MSTLSSLFLCCFGRDAWCGDTVPKRSGSIPTAAATPAMLLGVVVMSCGVGEFRCTGGCDASVIAIGFSFLVGCCCVGSTNNSTCVKNMLTSLVSMLNCKINRKKDNVWSDTSCCERLPSQNRQHGFQETRKCNRTKQTNVVRSFNGCLSFCNAIHMGPRT